MLGLFKVWSTSSLYLIAIFFSLLCSPAIHGVQGRTVTIDDSDSGIRYSSTWSIGNTCTTCAARPDPSRVYGRTWHDETRDSGSTDNVYFEYTFQGTGVSIYAIIVNRNNGDNILLSRNDLTFTLDGANAGNFVHEPTGDNSYQYNQAVFSRSGLPNQSHTIRVTMNPNSMMLFDYLTYTVPDPTTPAPVPPTTTTSSTSTGTSTTTSNSNSNSNSASASTGTSGSSTVSGSSTSNSTSNLLHLGDVTFSISGGVNGSEQTGAISSIDQTRDGVTLSKAAIVGICSGILILLLLLLLLLFLLWRRNRKQRNLEAPEAFLLGGRRPSDSTHTLDATNSVNASRLSSINNLPLAIQLHPDEKRPTTIWTTSNESSNVTGNTSNSLYIQYSNDGRRSESDNGVVAETGRGGSSGQSGDGNRLGNGSWTSQTSLSNSRPQSRSSPHLRISGISERSSNEAGSEMSYSEVPPPPPYSSSNDNVFSIYSNPPISIHHTRPG